MQKCCWCIPSHSHSLWFLGSRILTMGKRAPYIAHWFRACAGSWRTFPSPARYCHLSALESSKGHPTILLSHLLQDDGYWQQNGSTWLPQARWTWPPWRQQSQSHTGRSLPHGDLWCWLADHEAPRSTSVVVRGWRVLGVSANGYKVSCWGWEGSTKNVSVIR